MRVASIDMGSNSFLLLVAEVSKSGAIDKVLHDECVITRLGEGVDRTGKFNEVALKRAQECLQKYATKIEQFGVDKVQAVSTSAARDVLNKDEFFEIGEKLSIPIVVISGENEAQLTYMGTVENPKEKNLIVDVGGGSTEVVWNEFNGELNRFSFDIGAVRLTERFISGHPIEPSELKKSELYIESILDPIKATPLSPERVYAVAGTPTTLACLIKNHVFNTEIVQGMEVTLETTEHWIEKLSALNIEQRLSLEGLKKQPGRADVVVCGLQCLAGTLRALGISEYVVSTRGVRYGLAKKMAMDTH